jgi:hypothetical protein
MGNSGTGPEEYAQEWRLHTMFDTIYPECPHLASIVCQGVNNTGPLLRTEFLTIIGIILDRMRSEWSETQLIFPLMVFSMIGTEGRILLAHYDGDKLHVRYSQLYEFKEFDKDNMDLFLRWMMNEPVGDTAIVAPEEDNDLGSVHRSPSKKLGNRLQGHPEISLAA